MLLYATVTAISFGGGAILARVLTLPGFSVLSLQMNMNKIMVLAPVWIQWIIVLLFYSNIDRKDSGLLTQQQFRAAIEGRFELNMSDQEFDAFLKKIPIDSDGMVKYVEFMSKFDTL